MGRCHVWIEWAANIFCLAILLQLSTMSTLRFDIDGMAPHIWCFVDFRDRTDRHNTSSSTDLANTLQNLGLNHTIQAQPASQPTSFTRNQSINGGFTVHSPTVAAQQPISVNPTASRYSPSTVGYSPYTATPKTQSPTTPSIYHQRESSSPVKQYKPVNYNPTPTAYQAPATQYRQQRQHQPQPAVAQSQYQANVYSPANTTATGQLYSHHSQSSTAVPTAPQYHIPAQTTPAVEQFNGFTIPSTEQVLSERQNGTHLTVRQGQTISTGFQPGTSLQQPAVYHLNGHTTPTANHQHVNMNGSSPQVTVYTSRIGQHVGLRLLNVVWKTLWSCEVAFGCMHKRLQPNLIYLTFKACWWIASLVFESSNKSISSLKSKYQLLPRRLTLSINFNFFASCWASSHFNVCSCHKVSPWNHGQSPCHVNVIDYWYLYIFII
mgnify:FL=1